MKALKTQGYASPLTVINEGELLDCSVTNEESKQDGAKRTTRATRAGTQAKRQQPKRVSRKKNVPDTGIANEEQSDSSSVDEKPRRTTRNSRKKIPEFKSSVDVKQAASAPSSDENKLPKRSTRKNTREKLQEDVTEVSSTEEPSSQPVLKKSKSGMGKKLEDSAEIMAAVVEGTQTLGRSARNSNSSKEEESERETENRAHVPETPDPPADVTNNVLSTPVSAKTCKATVHLVLQSPGFSFGKGNGATPLTTSSPCVEQDLETHGATVEDISQSEEKVTADSDAVTLSLPVLSLPQESGETCRNELNGSSKKEDFVIQEQENHTGNLTNAEMNSDAIDGGIKKSKEETNTGVKSGKRSIQRNSGWRKKSKRSSHHFSPTNKRLSVKKAVTKSKTPGKKSLVKSSVKLKLTHSKLMPELKMNGTTQQISGDKASEPDLEEVRVRLFDNMTSESSDSASSATSHSSCGSNEDKADAPVEKHLEESVDDDVGEVFHDCRSENEADDENENAGEAKSDRYASSVDGSLS